MRKYTPRRANKRRWLEGAPDYVLDVFDNGGMDNRRTGSVDRYTVFFTEPLTYHQLPDGTCKEGSDTLSNTFVQYLGMSGAPTHPQGVSLWGELKAYEAANFRNRFKHQRIKWADLPANIQAHVKARAEDTGE